MFRWFEDLKNSIADLFKSKATIRKDGTASKPYCVYSMSGKNMGCYKTRKGAEKRLAQIEMFKHINEGK